MNRWLCVKLIQSTGCLKVKQTWLQHVKIEVRYCPDALPTQCSPPSSASWAGGPRSHGHPPPVSSGPAAGWHTGAEPPPLQCHHAGGLLLYHGPSTKEHAAVQVDAEFCHYRPNPLPGYGQPPRPSLHTTNTAMAAGVGLLSTKETLREDMEALGLHP